MDAQDWGQLGLLANDIFIQDYALTHPGTTIPTATTASVNLPGVQGSINTSLLIVAIAIVALVVLTK